MVSLQPPTRRDVVGMKQTLEAIEPPTTIAALFRDDLYGLFAVEGPLTRSDATSKLMVGGWFLEIGLQPSQQLLALVVVDAAAREPDTPRIDPCRAAHGTLVRATFEQHPYEQFVVAGHVVETDDRRMSLVGSWILHRDGHINPRLRRLIKLEPQGISEPPRIRDWRNETSTS